MGKPKIRVTDSKLHRVNGLSRAAIEAARKTSKMLPHELLLCWANGIEIAGLKPDPAQQLYAAVAAAPYYQPKLANIEVKQDVRVKAVISAAPMTQHQWAQKYLNQESNTVSPQVTYEVSQSLVHENKNTNAELAEAVVAPVGGEHVPTDDAQPRESSETSESLDPPSKS
jgi:hypothetical protein